LPKDFLGHFGINLNVTRNGSKTAFDYIDIQGMLGTFAM